VTRNELRLFSFLDEWAAPYFVPAAMGVDFGELATRPIDAISASTVACRITFASPHSAVVIWIAERRAKRLATTSLAIERDA